MCVQILLRREDKFMKHVFQKSLSKDISKFMKELNLPAMGLQVLEADEDEEDAGESEDEEEEEESDGETSEEGGEAIQDSTEISVQTPKEDKGTPSKANLVSCID